MRGLIDSPGFVRRGRVFGAFELQKAEKSCQPGQKYNEVNPLILRQLDCRRSFCGAQVSNRCAPLLRWDCSRRERHCGECRSYSSLGHGKEVERDEYFEPLVLAAPIQ